MVKWIGVISLAMRMSKLYGMDIYTDSGAYLGKAYDIIVDLESGEVVRLTLEPLKSVQKAQIKELLKFKSIMYKSIKSVRDILIVSSEAAVQTSMPAPTPVPTPAPAPAGRVPRYRTPGAT